MALPERLVLWNIQNKTIQAITKDPGSKNYQYFIVHYHPL